MAEHQYTPEELIRHKLDLLLRTGCMLMESLADTARITRTMKRAEAYLGLPENNIHAYISYNMLMVNLSNEDHSFTKFQRVDKHSVDMSAISAISNLTWRAIREDYTLEQYEQALDAIHSRRKEYTPWLVAIGGGFACGGFCVQFGCDWPAFFYASLAAILAFRLRMWLNTRGSNGYFNIAIAAFAATILAWLTSLLSTNPAVAAAVPQFMHSATPWHPLMACALFIVPGVPLINFVNDMMCGYIEVGFVRAVNVLVIICAMSFGIVAAIYVCGIDNFVKDLSMTPHNSYLAYSVAAAISAMGFSMIFNVPRHLLPVVALGGIIAVCMRNFVNLGPSNGNAGLDQGLIIGSFAGSALISLVCTKAMHWFHTPHHCLSIPSVIPMIPGVLMYRALFDFIDLHGVVGELTEAMNNAMKASLCILVISVGVAIPNIFVRRMTAPSAGRKLLEMCVDRRRRHGQMVDLEKL